MKTSKTKLYPQPSQIWRWNKKPEAPKTLWTKQSLYHKLCGSWEQSIIMVGQSGSPQWGLWQWPIISYRTTGYEPSGPWALSGRLSLSISYNFSSLYAFCTNVFRAILHLFERFFFSPLLFPAYISISPLLTLLFIAPPQLAPSVQTGVYFLFTSLMKVLNKTGWNKTSAHTFLWADDF
jgi:hypothetical protein